MVGGGWVKDKRDAGLPEDEQKNIFLGCQKKPNGRQAIEKL